MASAKRRGDVRWPKARKLRRMCRAQGRQHSAAASACARARVRRACIVERACVGPSRGHRAAAHILRRYTQSQAAGPTASCVRAARSARRACFTRLKKVTTRRRRLKRDAAALLGKRARRTASGATQRGQLLHSRRCAEASASCSGAVAPGTGAGTVARAPQAQSHGCGTLVEARMRTRAAGALQAVIGRAANGLGTHDGIGAVSP